MKAVPENYQYNLNSLGTNFNAKNPIGRWKMHNDLKHKKLNLSGVSTYVPNKRSSTVCLRKHMDKHHRVQANLGRGQFHTAEEI